MICPVVPEKRDQPQSVIMAVIAAVLPVFQHCLAEMSLMLELECLTEKERTEYIHTIINEASRLTALATNILNLSKVEQQSILTDQNRFNVTEQFRQVIALLDKKWSDKGISIVFDCGEVFYTGNEELLKQVWINLIDNAIKFSPEGEEIDIVIRESEESLAVSFTNKGDPIPAPALAHIFDKFYQADISHATQGNGLGLAIAQKIARLHGGNIAVPCSDTEGTVFEVVLPGK